MVSIEDSETGTTHPVNADFSLRFAGSRSKAAPVDPLAISRNPVFKTAATAPRFTLIIDPAKTTSVDRGPETVGRMELAQNFPNPFNPSTVIGFNLQSSHVTSLTVYDMLGREVAVLVNGSMPAGAHSVTFDASGLSSGTYIYRLEAGGQVLTRRMTLVK
jgi:hypothetical protein